MASKIRLLVIAALAAAVALPQGTAAQVTVSVACG